MPLLLISTVFMTPLLVSASPQQRSSELTCVPQYMLIQTTSNSRVEEHTSRVEALKETRLTHLNIKVDRR